MKCVATRLAAYISIAIILATFTSCVNTQKAVYFNDRRDADIEAAKINLEPTLRAGDLLSISVSSLNPESSLIYNTPNSSTSGANTGGTTVSSTGYLVAQDGTIQFPVLGTLQAAGRSKVQLKDDISKRLTERKLLVDPIVTVRYLNFRVTVIGEVNRPSVVTVPSEQINILEALGLAGDLTIYGRRDNVLLIREEEGKKIMKTLNLNSTDVLRSPYYYLKSNDVIYVEPNSSKVASSGRATQVLPIVLSGLSFAAIILDRLLR